MATRNRTSIFRKHRDAIKAVRLPDSSMMGGGGGRRGGGPVIEMTSLLNSHHSYTPLSTEDPSTSSSDAFTIGLPPTWVDISEEITMNIQHARVKMGELNKAHSKALMPSFGDGREDQHLIETLTHEITALLRKSEKKLKELTVGAPSEDSNVRKNVQRSLATDLQSLSVELRKKQSTYLKRLRQQQKEGQDGMDLEMNSNEGFSNMEDDEFGDMGFYNSQPSKLKESEHLASEREREIMQVMKSVNELAQIMKDLSVLVIDQGTIVDRIDYNIQSVSASVEEGMKQLQKGAVVGVMVLNLPSVLPKAERTQKQGGMVKCVTILVIMCLVMLVLLILKNVLL